MTRRAGSVKVLATAALVLVAGSAAYCLGEGALGGIRLDSPPSALQKSPLYGNPNGLIAPGGVFNSLSMIPAEEMGQSGLPHWAYAARMEGASGSQVQWIYNREPAAMAFLISGEGADARISGIVASLWTKPLRSSIVQTKKGIRLGDMFSNVVLKYGFPKTLIILSAPILAATAGPGALPAAGAGRWMQSSGGTAFGGARRGYAGGMSAKGIAGPALRGFGGRRDSGSGGGGMGATMAQPYRGTPQGIGPVPPATPLAPQYQEGTGQFSGSIMGQGISASKHMIIGYPDQGVEFALYEMQVVRIQVFPVVVGTPPTGTAGAATGMSTGQPTAPRAVSPVPVSSSPASTGGATSGLRFGGMRRR